MLVNGEPVGISKDARTPAEFDVTDVVRHGGPNELVAVVVRWSDASFVEDQDQWWHAGLSREVYLYATGATYIADVFARGDLDDATSRRPSRRRRPRSAGRPRGRELEARLLDPTGGAVATATFAGALELAVASPRRWSAEDPALYTLVVTSGGTSESVACRVGFRRVEIRERPAARERQGRADPRRQPPRPRRRRGRAVGRELMEADARLMKQFNVNAVRTLALPERPVLARPLRPLRPLRGRRGEHRVARLLRRALPTTPATRTRSSSACGTWSSGTRTIRASSPGRSATRAGTARTTTRPPAGCARATRRARSTTRARSDANWSARAARDRHRLPDVRVGRRDRGLGASRRRPAAR